MAIALFHLNIWTDGCGETDIRYWFLRIALENYYGKTLNYYRLAFSFLAIIF